MVIIFVIFILLVLVLLSIYFLSRRDGRHRLFGRILMELLIALGMWVSVAIWLLSIPHRYAVFLVLWLTVIPYGYYLFMVNLYWLFGVAEKKKSNRWVFYVLRLLAAIVLFSPFFLFYFKMGGINQIAFRNYLVLLFATTLVSIALAWVVYNKRQIESKQVSSLKKTLGQSVADLQLLRSQINPHFLFNALNTLYGMAIQEQATRTGEGIQRLGDMMRFMLEDNQREFIPLAKEIHYLEDYIYLQQLRLHRSENIQLNVAIHAPEKAYSIAPMLLIPFVENAFKYGVRLQKKSWINIQLVVLDDRLHLEVKNSRHAGETDSMDAKRASTGIGLENVKERLHLLYAGKHQLRIREEENEYMASLTLNV